MNEPELQDNGTVIESPRKVHMYNMDFGMAFVTKDNIQVSAATSCRDYLQDTVRTFLNDKTRLSGDGHTYFPDQGDPDLDMTRLRLLFRTSTTNEPQFRHALKVLNTIEAGHRMELSTAEKVKVRDDSATHILLKGSNEYMNNPHLLSLVTLTMRFCFYNKKFKVKNDKCLEDNYGKINPSKDSHLMCDCFNLMQHVMKNRKELFEGLTPKELFPIEINYDFHSKGGIQQLCRANTANKSVNDKMIEIKKTLKI